MNSIKYLDGYPNQIVFNFTCSKPLYNENT